MKYNWVNQKNKKRKSTTKITTTENKLLSLIEDFKNSGDFIHYHNTETPTPFWISYFQTLIDSNELHRSILSALNEKPIDHIEDIKARVPIEEIIISEDSKEIEEKLLGGYVLIQLKEDDKKVVLIKALSFEGRSISSPQIEFSVEGPKDAFVESLDTNIHLIRKRLPVPKLKIKHLTVGPLSKTKIAVVFMEGIANEQDVTTVEERIKGIKYDHISDSSIVAQLIEDNANSPFPQLKNSERPDRIIGQLTDGKVVLLVDGSPFALSGPTAYTEFFTSMEDYYLSWQVGTILRLIRYAAVTFSIFATPVYVAVLTFHYELIPDDLLETLIGSRSNIPFPPIIEAIFLELTIELLREAGARLPTKVGQTIGIVGGIVIGQASVEAGLTSNVLLILVALAALASFTTPVYKMGNTIRLLRFPFLFFSMLWGLLGIVLCIVLLLTHLLRLTSLGRPYLDSIYPPRVVKWKDTLFRLPFTNDENRQKDRAADVNLSKKIKAILNKQVKDIDE